MILLGLDFFFFLYDIHKFINLSLAYRKDEVLLHSNSENRYLRYLFYLYTTAKICVLIQIQKEILYGLAQLITKRTIQTGNQQGNVNEL